MAGAAMTELETIEAEKSDLSTHVQMCALRHKEINNRLSRIEKAIYAALAVILGGGAFTWEQLRLIASAAAKVLQP